MKTMTLPGLFTDPSADPRPGGREGQNAVAKEIDRLNAAAERVLERLKVGPATNVELSSPAIGGLRAVGRIHELREHGYAIGKEHVSGGIWLYRLISENSGERSAFL